RAVCLAAAVRAVPTALLQLPPSLFAAAPGPARAAVVLGVAGLLQPRTHLRVRAARLPAAVVPARAHARARPPARPSARPARAPAHPPPLAGGPGPLPGRVSHLVERPLLQGTPRRPGG